MFCELMAAAGDGKVVGAVVIALHPKTQGGRYTLRSIGTANTEPTLALGALKPCSVVLMQNAIEFDYANEPAS